MHSASFVPPDRMKLPGIGLQLRFCSSIATFTSRRRWTPLEFTDRLLERNRRSIAIVKAGTTLNTSTRSACPLFPTAHGHSARPIARPSGSSTRLGGQLVHARPEQATFNRTDVWEPVRGVPTA